MTSSRDPDWESVKTVAEVARAGTVRRAAAALGVHHSTVSRRVERLESRLGTRLFERHPEGYVPTPAGETLIEVALEFADRMAGVSSRLSGVDDRPVGRVVLTMPTPLAAAAFAPRLHELAETYPDIELELRTGMAFLDLARHEADVAVRLGDDPTETLVGKRLFAYSQSVYASPAYLAAHDLVRHPERGRWLGWDAADGPHPSWTVGTGFERVPVRGVLPELEVQVAAARGGLGLAMLPCLLGDREPGLVRATRAPPAASREVWLLVHPGQRRVARVRAVMGFAERVLRDLEPEIRGVARSEDRPDG